MALTWGEKLTLLTQKGMTWAEIKEMDKGLDDEKSNPPEPKPEPNPEPKPDDKPEPNPESKPEPNPEPSETEKKLLEKIEQLEGQLKEAQDENVHGNNGGSTEPTFDEQINEMFKDYRI